MAGFTKIFSSILDSTIWCEPWHIKGVWITMLTMADPYGNVHASVPGLAKRATVSIEECEEALRKFQAPDPYSRTTDFEGRRIEAMEGGWHLLNYLRYREMRDEDARREQNRLAQRRHRESAKKSDGQQKSLTVSMASEKVSGKVPMSAQAEAEAEEESTKHPPSPQGGMSEAGQPKDQIVPTPPRRAPVDLTPEESEYLDRALACWPQFQPGTKNKPVPLSRPKATLHSRWTAWTRGRGAKRVSPPVLLLACWHYQQACSESRQYMKALMNFLSPSCGLVLEELPWAEEEWARQEVAPECPAASPQVSKFPPEGGGVVEEGRGDPSDDSRAIQGDLFEVRP